MYIYIYTHTHTYTRTHTQYLAGILRHIGEGGAAVNVADIEHHEHRHGFVANVAHSHLLRRRGRHEGKLNAAAPTALLDNLKGIRQLDATEAAEDLAPAGNAAALRDLAQTRGAGVDGVDVRVVLQMICPRARKLSTGCTQRRVLYACVCVCVCVRACVCVCRSEDKWPHQRSKDSTFVCVCTIYINAYVLYT
jgi:hypothetical protein